MLIPKWSISSVRCYSGSSRWWRPHERQQRGDRGYPEVRSNQRHQTYNENGAAWCCIGILSGLSRFLDLDILRFLEIMYVQSKEVWKSNFCVTDLWLPCCGSLGAIEVPQQRSLTKALFSHRQLSVFEWSLARKLRFSLLPLSFFEGRLARNACLRDSECAK